MDAKRLEKGGVGKPEWSHSSDSVEERLEPPSSKSSSDPKSNPDAEPNEPAKSDATASDDPNKQEPGENGDHKGEEAMNALAGEEDDVAGSEVEATAPEEEEKENPASPAEGDGPVADSNGDDNMKTAASEKALDIQRQLLEQLMDRVICLEAEARQMLLDSMENGIARTLLLADRNGASILPTRPHLTWTQNPNPSEEIPDLGASGVFVNLSANPRCQGHTGRRRQHPLHLARRRGGCRSRARYASSESVRAG